MSKECFKSAELPHIWAHQRAEHGRVSGSNSQSFRGRTFYSYATAIATIIEHKGQRAFIVDTASFSVTTSGIQSAVRGAIPAGSQKFFVDCGHRGQSLDFTPRTLRDHYLAQFNEEHEADKRAFINARRTVAKQGALNKAIEVCKFFGLPSKKLENKRDKFIGAYYAADKLLNERQAKIDERTETRRAAERARRQAQEQAQIAYCIGLAEGDVTKLPDTGSGSINTFGWHDSYLETRPDLQAKIVTERERREALTVEDWRNNVPHSKVSYEHAVVLRINDGEIETSKGARFSVAAGRRAFEFAIARRSKGWKANGEQCEVDDYKLDAINDQGVVAGCHRIGWEELTRFATSVGWLDENGKLVG